jgi:hypothetical protein
LPVRKIAISVTTKARRCKVFCESKAYGASRESTSSVSQILAQLAEQLYIRNSELVVQTHHIVIKRKTFPVIRESALTLSLTRQELSLREARKAERSSCESNAAKRLSGFFAK